MTEAATPANIFNLGVGFWASKTLLSAVELGLFTELAKGRANLRTLSQRLGLHDRSARDFLDALVALNLLERQDGICSNTKETDLFLDRGKPSYVGGFFGNGQRPALSVLGLADRGAQDWPEPERGQATRRLDGPFVAGRISRGRITHRGGCGQMIWEATVQKIEHERLFSFTWHPYAIDPKVDYSQEPRTLVEFRLEATPSGTLLLLTESGFGGIPSGRRLEAFRMNEGGWTEQMKNIERYVETTS